MEFEILVLPGDGIGPEVVAEGVKVMGSVAKKFGHRFTFSYDDVGGAAIDKYGVPLRPETMDAARRCDAILFGAVGGPKWDDPNAQVHPEDAILGIRKEMGFYANIRTVKVFPVLADASVLKPEVIDGVDIVVIRELTGGLYYALPKGRRQTKHGWTSVDTMRYNQHEIERVLRVGFEVAQARSRKLVSVDKANVLETSRLWRQVATELASEYPDVELEHMLVDTCAMQLIQRPLRFDVIVAENTFGDILTDEAAVLTASMGLLPSASLAFSAQPSGNQERRQGSLGLYEPIHGSAPDIAGQGVANPIAAILSVALMMRYSLGLDKEADAVDAAVEHVLEGGYRTPDLLLSSSPGSRPASAPELVRVGTGQMGDEIAKAI